MNTGWARMAVALAVLGAAVALPLSEAAASKVTGVKSTVTITSGEGTEFTGDLAASKKKCEAGRTVKLYLEEDPPGRAGDKVVGTAKTGSDGSWVMNGNFLAGVYYAWVSTLVFHQGVEYFRCFADGSIPTQY